MPKGIWMDVGIGYGYGGKVFVNGEERNAQISSFKFGATLAFPLSLHHSIKLVGLSGRRLKQGPDFDGVSLVYQYCWLNK